MELLTPPGGSHGSCLKIPSQDVVGW